MNPSFVPSPSSDSVSIISPRPFSRDSSNGITRVTSPPFSNKVTPRNTNEEEEEPKTELQLQAAEPLASIEFSALLDQKIIMWASIALLLFVAIEVIKNKSLDLRHSI